MRPLLHPSLINGRTGDPVLYIETLFEKQAILFDLGDISALPPRKIHRLDHVFISHTHIDHFLMRFLTIACSASAVALVLTTYTLRPQRL